jgi:hypothetical protein
VEVFSIAKLMNFFRAHHRCRQAGCMTTTVLRMKEAGAIYYQQANSSIYLKTRAGDYSFSEFYPFR